MDVTELMIGQNVRAGSIPLAENMTLMSPKEQVIAHVIAMRVEEVEPAAADAAAAVAPAAAEPEVIKKGKKEEEAPEEKKKK